MQKQRLPYHYYIPCLPPVSDKDDGKSLASKLDGNTLVIGNKKLQDILEESAQSLGTSRNGGGGEIEEFLSTVINKADGNEETDQN